MDLLKELEGAKKIGISAHVKPDGDAVGSCLAMYGYLKNAMPDAKLTVFLQKPADCFQMLPYFDVINTSFVGINDFDAYISLDSGSIDRLSDAEPFFKRAKKSICIDHHISNTGFGDVYVVEGEASSTCEVLIRLFEDKYIDANVAACLYTGIVHDTGVLQYSNTKIETFKAIEKLLEYKIDTARIIDETFYEKTYVQNQILGRVLTESILFMDGKCIAGVVTQKMMNFYGAESTDLEGIVNQLRVTKGVEVAILLHELRTGDFKASMRSKRIVDCAKICTYFGGGGHVRAAGCTMKGTYHDALNNLSKLIEEQLAAESENM